MAREPIDPAPFEGEMPASVREVIALARRGEGPAKEWLVSRGGGWGQVGDCFGMLRGPPEVLAPEIVGWLVGIAMFGDDLHALPRIIVRERHRAAAPHVIDAFAAGIRAGVPTTTRQWKGIEEIVVQAAWPPPESLHAILADGVVSDQALERGVALGLAQKIGAPAREALQARAGEWSGKEKRRIDDALAALDAGHRDAAAAPSDAGDLLARLLAEWNATKDPALVEAIAHVGVTAAQGREALKARSKGELEAAWLALASAKDPIDVDRLLATPWPGAWKTALLRVRALAEFQPDPRILGRLREIAPTYPSWGSRPLHHAIGGLHARWVDPASLPGIESEIARHGHQFPTEYGNARTAIAAQAIGKANPALLDEAHRLADTKPAHDIAGLWKWFYEDPRDAQRRLVLADALQSQGDPRGEFIVLQVAIAEGRGDAKMRRRANELLEANIDAWTGHLPSIDRGSRRFERGFLVAARSMTRGSALAASLDLPEWRTIEELRLSADGDDALALLARLPCLRTFVTYHDGVLTRLAAGAPIASLRAIAGHHWMPTAPRWGLPNLAVVAGLWFRYQFDVADLRERTAAMTKSGIGAIVHANLDAAHLGDALRAAKEIGPRETRIAFEDRWDRAFDPEGWRVRVRQDIPDADLAWGGGSSWKQGGLANLLQTIASSGHDRIRVHPTRSVKGEPLEEAKRLAETLAPRGITITFDGEPIDLAAPPR